MDTSKLGGLQEARAVQTLRMMISFYGVLMIHSILFIAIALVFVLGKIVLEKRLAPLDAAGDERVLADLAFSMGCSVYDLFKAAGEEWNFSQAKTDSDFKQYTRDNIIPRYVHDYISKQLTDNPQTYQKLLFSGGRPPYL